MIEISTGVFVKTEKPNKPWPSEKTDRCRHPKHRIAFFFARGQSPHAPAKGRGPLGENTPPRAENKKMALRCGPQFPHPVPGASLGPVFHGLRTFNVHSSKRLAVGVAGFVRPRHDRLVVAVFLFEANAGTNIPGLMNFSLSHGAPLPQSQVDESAQALDGIRWRDPEEGFAEANRTGRPLLLDFTAEWCGWCHRLENDVLSNPEVARYINQHYVPVKVMDRMREEGKNNKLVSDLQAKFDVGGFPTLAVTQRELPKILRATRLHRGSQADVVLSLQLLGSVTHTLPNPPSPKSTPS
jgi:thioredoxin-related protein